jgi:hypothetical protein
LAEDERLGIGKQCPHCGVRAATLGTVCPACNKSYRPPDLLDRLPFPTDEMLASRYGLEFLVLLLIGLGVLFVLLAIRNWVAAVLLAGLAFGLLVGAIGLSNWMSDRAEARRREHR